MARINIDDELRADPRFHDLCDLIPRAYAYGALVCFWELGQSFWKKNRSKIPIALFQRTAHHQELVEVGFATIEADGVYCSGAKERWGFLINDPEKGRIGGLASAEARRAKFGTAIPKGGSNSPEQLRTTSNPPKHSSSSGSATIQLLGEHRVTSDDPTPVSIGTKEPLAPLGGVPVPAKRTHPDTDITTRMNQVGLTGSEIATRDRGAPGGEAQAVIATYVSAYQKRYGAKARPALSGKVVGQVKTLLKHCPPERAKNLIEVYLQIDDDWFKKKHYDLVTFTENLNKISLALDTGQNAGSLNWSEIFGDLS